MRALEIVQKIDRRAHAIARGAGEWAPNISTEIKTRSAHRSQTKRQSFLIPTSPGGGRIQFH